MAAREAVQARAIRTRDTIVDAAYRLLVTKGYPATTVDDICRDAGVSKGSFYHFFESKEEIAIAAVDWYFESAQLTLNNGPWTEVRDPVDRALAFIDHAIASGRKVWGNGCLLGTMAIEAMDASPDLHKAVRRRMTEIAKGLETVLAPISALAGGSPTPAELARVYVSIVEGAIVLSKSENSFKPIPEGLRTFRRFLEALSGR